MRIDFETTHLQYKQSHRGSRLAEADLPWAQDTAESPFARPPSGLVFDRAKVLAFPIPAHRNKSVHQWVGLWSPLLHITPPVCTVSTDLYSSATRASTSYLGFERASGGRALVVCAYLCRCRLILRHFIRRILGLLVVPATTGRVERVPGLEERRQKKIDQVCRK